MAIFGTLFGAIAALAGCVAVAAVWRTGSSLPWKLIGSTAMTVAFVAVQLSPFGELVRVWMLD